MNVLSLIVIGIIVLFAVLGARRGLVRMLFSILRLVVILVFGMLLTSPMAAFLTEHTGLMTAMQERLGGSESTAAFVVRGIAFLASVLVVSLVFCLIRALVDKVAKLPVLRTVNRVLGFLFGVVEGFVIAWIVLYVIQIIATFGKADGVLEMINSSRFLSLLAENNPFSLKTF